MAESTPDSSNTNNWMGAIRAFGGLPLRHLLRLFIILLALLLVVRWAIGDSITFRDGTIQLERGIVREWRYSLHAAQGMANTEIRVKRGEHVVISASGRTETSVAAYQDYWGMLDAYARWWILDFCRSDEDACKRLPDCKNLYESATGPAQSSQDNDRQRIRCGAQIDLLCVKPDKTEDSHKQGFDLTSAVRKIKGELLSGIPDADVRKNAEQNLDLLAKNPTVTRTVCMDTAMYLYNLKGNQENAWAAYTKIATLCGKVQSGVPRQCPDDNFRLLPQKVSFADVFSVAAFSRQIFHHSAADADGEPSDSYSKKIGPLTNGRQYPHFEDDKDMFCPVPHGRLIVWICNGSAEERCRPAGQPERCAHSGKRIEFDAEQDGTLWAVINDSDKFTSDNMGLMVLSISIKNRAPWSWLPGF